MNLIKVRHNHIESLCDRNTCGYFHQITTSVDVWV